MAYSPDLDDAVSRVRFGVGDTGEPPLLRGGEAVYEALLLIAQQDEAAVIRTAAAALAAQYATEPDSIGDSGTTLRWSERVAQWNLIAKGQAGGSQTVVVDTSLSAGFLSWNYQEG